MTSRLLTPFALAVLSVLVAGGAASADPAAIKVGDVRAVQNRHGIDLRAEADPTSDSLAILPYAARLQVEEVKGYWIKVTNLSGTVTEATPRTGWVKKSQTVDPWALSGASTEIAASKVAGGTVAAQDAAAAGRGFNAEIESSYRASSAELQKAYAILDSQIVGKEPSPTELVQFTKEGRLGRPGKGR